MKNPFQLVFWALLAGCLGYTWYDYGSDSITAAGLTVVGVHTAVFLLIAWLALRSHPAFPDAYRRSRLLTMGLGLLWGYSVTGPAIFFNGHTASLLQKANLMWLDGAGYAPAVEETLKLAGVLLIATGFLRLRRAIEAVPLGIAVGFGFAMGEDPHYIWQSAIKNSDSDLMGALTGVISRLLAGPFNHSMFTGLAAFGVGLMLCRTGRLRSVLKWWLFAVLLHGLSNLAPALAGLFADVQWVNIAMPVKLLGMWILAVWLYLRSRKLGRRQAGAQRRAKRLASNLPQCAEVSVPSLKTFLAQ